MRRSPPGGDRRAALAALDVHELDGHSRQESPGLVAHEALNRRERLGGGRCGNGEDGAERDGGQHAAGGSLNRTGFSRD